MPRARRIAFLLAVALAGAAPAATLRVALSPPRDPEGRSWRLELRDGDSDALLGEYGTADDGTWSRRGLPRKMRTTLVVKTDAGQPWWRSEKPFALEEEVTTVPVALGLVKADGALSWGGGGIAAELVFTDERVGTRVTARAARDGTFRVSLPRNGFWDVRVTAMRPHVFAETRAEVEGDKDGRYHVAVAIASDGLEGEVVDEQGRSVPNAFVHVSHSPEYWNERSDAEGLFRIPRVAPGIYRVDAHTKTHAANHVEVEWVTRTGAPFVTLVLLEQQQIRGVLRDPAGRPLKGALARLVDPPGPPRHPLLELGGLWTDADGRFTLLPAPGVERHCTLVAGSDRWPSLAAEMLPLPVSAEVQELTLRGDGGTLSATLPVSSREARAFVIRNGCTDSAFDLAWATATRRSSDKDRTRFEFLRLAPGPWTVCVMSWDVAKAWGGGAPPADARCATAVVIPGGLASLAIP